MPLSEIDIYRTAKLVIDQHGDTAPEFAVERADALRKQGDLDGVDAWLAIFEAILELRRTKPGSALLN